MTLTLKQARIGINATQKDIAHKMGIHPQTYLKFEKNPSCMTIAQAKSFAKITGVTIEQIFFAQNSN